MTLHGQVILVCDAGEPALAAAAGAFAAAGATLVLLSPAADRLRAVAAAVRRAGGEVHALPLRVGAEGATERVAACVTDLAGRVDRLLLGGTALPADQVRALTAALRALLQARPGGRVRCLVTSAGAADEATALTADLVELLRPTDVAADWCPGTAPAGEPPAGEPWVSLLAWAGDGGPPFGGTPPAATDPPS